MTSRLQGAEAEARPDMMRNSTPGRARLLISGLRFVLQLGIVVAAALVFLPLAPAMPQAGLDPGWVFGMNQAINARLAFGTDLIFTFGPYAFIYTNEFSPGLSSLHFFGGFVIGMAFILGLYVLSRRTPYPTISCATALALTFFLPHAGTADVIYMSIPVLYLFVCWTHQGKGMLEAGALISLAFSLSLLTLTKGSFALASLLVIIVGFVSAMVRRTATRGVFPVVTYLLALPALWILAGQNLSSLSGFVGNSVEVIRGYSNAMSITGPIWQPILFCFAAVVLFAANRRRFNFDIPDSAFVLCSAALLFLSFKAGFVRHDGHAMIAGGMLAVIAFAFALTAPLRRASWLGVFIGLSSWVAITQTWMPLTARSVLQRAEAMLWQGVAGAIGRIQHPDALSARYDAALSSIRAAHPLPPVEGTADIYSFGQSRLLSHAIDWSPRPVFQSYSVYTSRLAEMNARHLLGRRAPDTVFFAAEPIDGRLAAMEDGASWPALLSRYELRDLVDDVAVFRRRPANEVKPVIMRPISSSRYDFGENVPLPREPAWATVAIRPTLLGQAISVLFRAPVLHIVLQFPDGQEKRHRFIAGAASAGFLVSPVVETTADFVMLVAGEAYFPANKRPIAFRLEGGSLPANFLRLFWAPAFEIGLHAVILPADARARDLALAPFSRPMRVDTPPAPARGVCHLDSINGGPPSARVSLEGGLVAEVVGWGFLTGPRRHSPSHAALLLTGADETVLSVPVTLLNRPDVAHHFGQDDLVRVGFRSRLNLDQIAGSFTVSLELSSEHGRETCKLHTEPFSIRIN